ncbi:MAG TPA: hypothetical protein VH062_34680 [Polyangiaceae bacterium]|jgi:hypothetical protein|nr:hypothetical protein [Polyangiaceae bacterium]
MISSLSSGRPFNAFERLLFNACARDETMARAFQSVAGRVKKPKQVLGPALLARMLWVNLTKKPLRAQGPHLPLETSPDHANMSNAPARAFQDFTASHVGRKLAMLMDGLVVAAPTIAARIAGGHFTLPAPSPAAASGFARRLLEHRGCT